MKMVCYSFPNVKRNFATAMPRLDILKYAAHHDEAAKLFRDFLVADFHVVGFHVFRSDVLAENTVSVGIAFDSNVAAKGATGENHKRSNERNGNLTISTSSLLTL